VAEKFSFVGVSATNEKSLSLRELCASSEAGGEETINARRKRMYTDKVMDHFSNPRNIGEIENADGVGEVGNPVCGDMMSFYINVKDNKITDIKFKTFGCVAAIAVSSMVTEMALGKTLDEAKKITKKSVAESLDGLPKEKMHCSNLGADALNKAIEDFESKQLTATT
jgi:nitrogen fixation NifU-like protein